MSDTDIDQGAAVPAVDRSDSDGWAALPVRLLLTIAAIQGVLLYLLWLAHDLDAWPSESPIWSTPLWTLAWLIPAMLLLTLNRGRVVLGSVMIGVFAIGVWLLTAYTGWVATPWQEAGTRDLFPLMAVSIAVGAFKLLMYLQQRLFGLPFAYAVLFRFSWRNALMLALAVPFATLAWLILRAGGELFALLEITFLRDLVKEPWSFAPMVSIAGVGIVIMRRYAGVIDAVARLLRGLMTVLLPVVLLFSVTFLVLLPFTGFGVLWATGFGTSLLLALLAGALFMVNAVYQDGTGALPYPPLIHRAVSFALLSLPLVSALALYGLYARVDQYGWSVARLWAGAIWVILSLFALGYVAGVITRRDRWPAVFARVNIVMGLVVLVLALAVNSPALDFRRITVDDQLARADRGDIALEALDYRYFRRSLGRHGYLAIERIRDQVAGQSALLAAIERSLVSEPPTEPVPGVSREQAWSRVLMRSDEAAEPPIPDAVRERVIDRVLGDLAIVGTAGFSVDPVKTHLLVAVELDGEAPLEFVLISHAFAATAYAFDGTQWRTLRADMVTPLTGGTDQLLNAPIEVVVPRFDDLAIGEVRWRIVDPENGRTQ